ncbi:MAG: nucleotide pyrophosphohydrolase [Parcubacteria group bacterium]|jgi:NTP pyrophosphatase (non-canonical NTP hydrolase)
MELKDLIKKAVAVREKYAELEIRKYGKNRTNGQIAEGFVGDVGDLIKLVMAKEGIRDVQDTDEKLEHELADCLYSVFVLADKYGVDLEKSFLKTMSDLEVRISKNDG